jgi:hypothetical protein
VPLPVEGGITAVVAAGGDAFARACEAADIKVFPEAEAPAISPDDAAKADRGVIKAGIWPGVRRFDRETASATRSLWLDQNCSLVQYSRAMFPHLTDTFNPWEIPIERVDRRRAGAA